MGKNRADKNDKHIGDRLKLRRIALNMSQQALGAEIGVTFQQIQKYESGANRISAGRLLTFAKVLNVPITYFFEDAPSAADLPAMAGDSEQLSKIMANKDTIKLALAYNKIKDRKVRANLMRLTDTLAG